ncbi:chlorophyll A-B binding protein [Nitzschia inconspicua]|uniref:Chlorophyll A-B binding protein n=1 Tax=Nitzschia inconspicua TaxID=303405 RepID=A0A9K3PPW4_9STRA|nr:chlorophyll A-B binding protein [Nitzschia inconspicua]
MKLSLAIAAAAAISSVSAFAPSMSTSVKIATNSALFMSEEVETAVETPTTPAPLGPTLNGWTPDASKPCYGLPGAISPLGYFDPLGFCTDRSLAGVKRFREAEVLHSRVAMMAVLGYLIGENTPTITYGFDVPTIANNQIPEVSLGVMFPFFLVINISEAFRASKGWVEPGLGPLFTLRENYYPGDLGFDPLGLKPSDPKEFADMQAKELSNGRLAMFAAIGMMVQELVNGQPVLADLPF